MQSTIGSFYRQEQSQSEYLPLLRRGVNYVGKTLKQVVEKLGKTRSQTGKTTLLKLMLFWILEPYCSWNLYSVEPKNGMKFAYKVGLTKSPT